MFAYIRAFEKCLCTNAYATRAYNAHFGTYAYIYACANVKDGFREKRKMRECVHASVRACMRAYVCTEDGGAGRKRGGDSVCEKEKENMQLATLSN